MLGGSPHLGMMQMRAALSSCWPLLLGIALMMLGNGLQGSLLGVRASIEGFPTAITGLVMSGFYVGFLFGSILTPKILVNVGHVRVFAALASLASTATLLHAMVPEPITWGFFRILTGFCFAGLFIVCESWLNDVASNETRGQILSFYMAIVWVGMAGGQFLLTTADPGGYNLFIIVSVLVSLALVPAALTASPAPNVEEVKNLGLRKLYKVSPLGVIGVLIIGVTHGAFFAMAAVYGGLIGLSVGEISVFISAVIIGGAIFQVPIGRLSDKFDRRRIILFTAVFGAVVSSVIVFLQSPEDRWLFLGAAALFGGSCMPIYSLFIAHTNDHLEPDQMVAASSSMILLNGVGAIIGPILVSSLMAEFGVSAYFASMTVGFIAISLFTMYRMSIKKATPLEEQGDFVAMPIRSGVVAATMNPETEEWEEETDEKEITHPFYISRASMSILEDFEDEEDEDQDLTDDGPSLWNRNG